MSKTFKRSAIATMVAIVLSPSLQAQAADVEATQENSKFSQVEKIIVTGSMSGKAVRKVDASYAITSISAEDIGRLAPKSTADLFKAIPGVWAESSGGVSGANVFVRGFPGGGDAPFLSVQLQGSVVYPPSTLSFLENSTLFRLDETVDFMEALRGGPNPVISNGQPGLTTNFLLKEGSEETAGTLKYTTSDFGLNRVDAVLSGSLAEDLYFMVGGYVKSSPGVKDAGFNAEEGHQFTINITKEFDNGKFNIYTRQTDDAGVWYLPVPFGVDGVDNEYNQVGTKNRQATIQYGPDGDSKSFDFGEGRGWNGSVSGGSLNLDFGDGWTFVDKFNFTKGDANTFGLVPNGTPVQLSTVADNGVNATGAATGDLYDGDTYVQQIGRWVVLKEIESFTNDLALTKKWENVKGTLGYYSADFSVNDWWALGNQSYHVVESGGENLTGIDCNDNQDSCGWNYDINSAGDGSTNAFYAAVEYKPSDVLTLDVGVRNENHEIEYTVDEGLNGQISKFVSYDETEFAWTLGANYALTDDSGVFVRLNNGSKMPTFDDFRDNYGAYSQDGADLISEISQAELGYKIAADNFSVYATGFFNESKGNKQVVVPGTPAVVFTTEALGVEIDANYFTDSGFSLSLNATIQDTEITQGLNEGNEVLRQPGWMLRVTPSYAFELANDMYGTVYGTLSAVDDRWGDNANNKANILEGYEKVDAGVIVSVTDQLEFRVSVDNLLDEEALTEGDPRAIGTAANGRFIMPRSFRLSVAYEF